MGRGKIIQTLSKEELVQSAKYRNAKIFISNYHPTSSKEARDIFGRG